MSAKKSLISLDSSLLRSHLKLKHIQTELLLKAHHSEAMAQLSAAGVRPGSIRDHVNRVLTAGVLTTSLFLTPGQATSVAALPESARSSALVSTIDLNQAMQQQLSQILPQRPAALTSDQEQQVSSLIHQIYGLHATGELEGNHLNTTFGFIGLEQNLPRYPGDSVANMTPGRGAWGYFADSKDQLTDEQIEMEKFYVAVQTLYLPDWSTRLAYLRDWYKFRKVVVVNPANGKLVIAAIADSGPAAWTGKSFGGSPEVMDYLNLKDGRQKGGVVLFFVDDPDNQIPYGPLEYNLEAGPPLLTTTTTNT